MLPLTRCTAPDIFKSPLVLCIICGPHYTLVHGYVTDISGFGHIPWWGRQIIKEITFFFEHLQHLQKFDLILRILSVHIIYRILFLKQLQKLSSLCHYWSVKPNSSTEFFFISISFNGYGMYDRMLFQVTETFTVYLIFAHFWQVSTLVTLKKEAVSSDVITDQLTY